MTDPKVSEKEMLTAIDAYIPEYTPLAGFECPGKCLRDALRVAIEERGRLRGFLERLRADAIPLLAPPSGPDGDMMQIFAWQEFIREIRDLKLDGEGEAIAKEGRIIDGAISRTDDEEYGKGGILPAKGE
jgi:hypothetical protein